MTADPPPDRDRLKRIAAEFAVEEIRDGMVVGLGTGSTASLMVEALAGRVARGLRVTGIATSERTADLARGLGIPLGDFDHHRRLDLAIDGADEVDARTLDLLKGRGGALLREKIVALASRRLVIVVDETKLVARLAASTPVPVEIVPFGWRVAFDRLAALKLQPRLRRAGAAPFHTDGGNLILDCVFPGDADLAGVDARVAAITGVVGTGLFLGLADRVVVGTPAGVRVLERPQGRDGARDRGGRT